MRVVEKDVLFQSDLHLVQYERQGLSFNLVDGKLDSVFVEVVL